MTYDMPDQLNVHVLIGAKNSKLPDIDLEELNLLMNLLMQIPGFLKRGIRDDNIIFRFAFYSYDDKEYQ